MPFAPPRLRNALSVNAAVVISAATPARAPQATRPLRRRLRSWVCVVIWILRETGPSVGHLVGVAEPDSGGRGFTFREPARGVGGAGDPPPDPRRDPRRPRSERWRLSVRSGCRPPRNCSKVVWDLGPRCESRRSRGRASGARSTPRRRPARSSARTIRAAGNANRTTRTPPPARRTAPPHARARPPRTSAAVRPSPTVGGRRGSGAAGHACARRRRRVPDMVKMSAPAVNCQGAVGTSAELRRWLALGRDVVLRGDHGAGKSTALRSLRVDLSGRRRPGIVVRGAGPGDHATLLDHPALDVEDATERALLAWLVDELSAPRSVLMLDDLDRVDGLSLRLVERALRRTGAALVATTTANPLRLEVPEARSVLASRAPAALRVRPLDLAAVSTMLSSVLGGPADTGLTTAVLAQSGGNPGAIAALVAAARASDVLRRSDGHWSVEGRLADVPADALAFQFLGSLRDELVDALRRMAAIGPVDADEAMRIVDPVLLHDLIDRGRLVNHPVAAAGDVLVVAPPALARALRQGVSIVERRGAAARASADVGRQLEPVLLREDDLHALIDAELSEQEGFLRWSTELAGLVHEQEQIAESLARAAWLEDSTVANANTYLALLMLRYETTQIDSVFRATALSPRDTAADRLTFRSYQLYWLNAQGVGEELLRTITAGWGDEARSLVDVHGLKERAVAAINRGEPIESVLTPEAARHQDPVVQGRRAFALAAAAIEVGQPATALSLCEGYRDVAMSVTSRHHLNALRVLAKIVLGRTEEAEQEAREHLSAAYDAYDTLGIRLHACVLAEALSFHGQLASAWRVLSTSLLLGHAGPLDETFYRRGLTIGTLLQANAGHATLCAALVRELDVTARSSRSLISSLHALAPAPAPRRSGHPGGGRIAS